MEVEYEDIWRYIPSSWSTPVVTKKPAQDPIKAIHDVDLILELIARGYAVWKPPVGQ